MRALHHPPVLFLQLALPILSEILNLTWGRGSGAQAETDELEDRTAHCPARP